MNLHVMLLALWEFDRAGINLFGLSSEDNLLFIRLCIKALLDAGARPVTGGNGTIYDWIPIVEFGETHEEITDKVITWWLEGIRTKGYNAFWVDYVWFATPHLCQPHENKPLVR